MTLDERIKSFEMLGDRLRRYNENSPDGDVVPLIEAAGLAASENPWFTHEHIRIALNSLGDALQPENLNEWLSRYDEKFARPHSRRTVGVVMAGNIPAVGFHDFLCVLIAGHKLVGKLSSADARLLPAMAAILIEVFPEWQKYITFTTGRLEGFDAIIATGSNNTSRYFNFYFGKYPGIIRKNRNSIAILDGNEDGKTLQKLADDIMLYFGMGCRSVSKIYVPRDYDFSSLIGALKKYHRFTFHNKYLNNYEYSKTIFLVNQVPFIDAGCLIFREDDALASRIAVLNYEIYDSIGEVVRKVEPNLDMIQCVVSAIPLPVHCVKPGEAQNPALWDYADGIDTLDFLLS
jgi:hypothetical protein